MWAIAPEIQELHAALKLGQFDVVQKKIKAWLKKNSPRPFERIRLSEYYTWMGLDSQSAKILGPPLSMTDLQNMDPAQLCIQLRLSYVLGMMGVKYVALTLMKNVRSILDERAEIITHHYPQYYQNYAYLHLSYYLTEEARWGFEEALKLYPQNSYQYFYISLGLADCDALEGNYALALERAQALLAGLDQLEDQLLKATCEQAIGEYLNYDQRYTEARVWFEKSFYDFGPDNQTKDYAYLLKHSGLGHAWQGNTSAGIEQLTQAKHLLARADQTPTSLIEILFWIEHFAPEELSVEEKLTLRAYPNYSVYSLRAGRNQAESDHTRHPGWLPQQANNDVDDVWLVQGDEIKESSYEKVISNKLPAITYDLNSCLILEDSEVQQNLTELQTKLLLALAGAGERGVHQYLLADYIYQQEFVAWEAGLDRIKKALKTLAPYGVEVKLQNLNYVWVNRAENLILVKSLKPKPWLAFARARLPQSFGSVELAELLKMSTRSAQRLLMEWRQADLIEPLAAHTYRWRGKISIIS